MSVREADLTPPGALVVDNDVLTGRQVTVGRYQKARRYLPDRSRRLIGAWCFADHFGPDDLSTGSGMSVPPHPHVGLQTVTWLFEGEVVHRDSLGSIARIRSGQLNLMTSGRGIAHAEQSDAGTSPLLHGLQLWIALPAAAREMAPAFAHYDQLPEFGDTGARVVVIAGELGGRTSAAATYSPLVGADLDLDPDADLVLPVESTFEYGLLAVTGEVALSTVGSEPIASATVRTGSLRYVPPGQTQLRLVAGPRGARLLFIGGEPYEDPLVMWWNFVAGDHESIVTARDDWAAGRRFGHVAGFDGDPMSAPEMPTVRLLPRLRNGSRA